MNGQESTSPQRLFFDELQWATISTLAAMQQYLPETELDFFQLLVLHTRQDFYARPIYSGNHNDDVGLHRHCKRIQQDHI